MKKHYLGLLCALLPTVSFSYYNPVPSEKLFYVVANAGVFDGTFNLKYQDQTDTIPQNIAETVQQKGYTGSLGVGISKILCNQYLLGLEFSGGATSQNAVFQSGAASSAFNDKFAIEHYFDLVAVPGILLTESIAAYAKIGVTRGKFSNYLDSPTGFTPSTVSTSSTRHAYGFTGSIGVKKWILPTLAILAEYNYRDYGTVSFPSFQNFTTTYSHQARIFSQTVQVGLTYQFV